MNDGVVGDAEVVEQLEQFADVHVVLDHAVAVFVLAGDAAVLLLHVGAKVHAGAVPPAEEWLAGLDLALDEVLGRGDGFVVNRLHPLLGQRAGVLDSVPLAGRSLAIVLASLQHATWTECLRNVLPLARTMSPG